MNEMTNTRDGEEFWVTTRAGETVELVRRSLYREQARILARREEELGPLRGLQVAAGHYRDRLTEASKIEDDFRALDPKAADDAACRRFEEAMHHADAAVNLALGAMFERLDACGQPALDLVGRLDVYLIARMEEIRRQINGLNDEGRHRDAVLARMYLDGIRYARNGLKELAGQPAASPDGDGALAADLDLLDGAGTDPAAAAHLIHTINDVQTRPEPQSDVELRAHLTTFMPWGHELHGGDVAALSPALRRSRHNDHHESFDNTPEHLGHIHTGPGGEVGR